jgi:hypothetical protein
MDRISEYAPSSGTGVSSDVERLRRDMSLSSTAAQYGYKLTRNGHEFATCCPFHAEDTPSFTIFIGQDGVERFHCFGCGRKGDVLDFVQEVILFGTTNESRYLTDTTGNRRFWIVRATVADPSGIAAVRDQLWAEAAYRESGENLWLDDPALLAQAAGVAREASDFGPWAELLGERIPDGPLKIKASDVWKLVGIDSAETLNKLTNAHRGHMRAAMAGLGFEKKDKGIRFPDGDKKAAYLRGDPAEAIWWYPGIATLAYDDVF